jgi:hypothetical protein
MISLHTWLDLVDDDEEGRTGKRIGLRSLMVRANEAVSEELLDRLLEEAQQGEQQDAEREVEQAEDLAQEDEGFREGERQAQSRAEAVILGLCKGTPVDEQEDDADEGADGEDADGEEGLGVDEARVVAVAEELEFAQRAAASRAARQAAESDCEDGAGPSLRAPDFTKEVDLDRRKEVLDVSWLRACGKSFPVRIFLS